MRIKRVDDKTVKCFLSNEELEAYEIDYKDFIMHSDKAKQVVQDILAQAAEQVGYKPPKFAFDVQIMVLQDQGILLTFSENDTVNNHAQKILDYFKDMKNIMEMTKDELGIGNVMEALAGQLPEADQDKQPAAESGHQTRPVQKSDRAIFEFETLRDVMCFADALPTTLRVQSSLYEMKDRYYLYLQKGTAAYERFSRTCIQAMEFGRLYSAQPGQELVLEEHGKCLIGEKAIQKLRG